MRISKTRIVSRLFIVLEECLHPILSTHLRFRLGEPNWKTYQKYLKYLLDHEFITYIGREERRPKARKIYRGKLREYLVITDKGKEILKLWKELREKLGKDIWEHF